MMDPMTIVRWLSLVGLACLCLPTGAEAQGARPNDMSGMDHGPFVSTTIADDPLSPTRSIVVHKGIAVRVASDPDAVITFDTDLLRVATAWTGGFLHWYPARDGLEQWPSPGGFPHHGTGQRPGWSTTGTFGDPRPWRYGPLPRKSGRYKGLYVQGESVVFAYTVGDGDVLERPGFVRAGGEPVFTRTFNLSPSAVPVSLHLVQAPVGGAVALDHQTVAPDRGYLQIRAGADTRVVGFQGLPEGAAWRLAHQHLVLDLPAREQALRFELLIGPASTRDTAGALADHLRQAAPVADLIAFTTPGPARWDVLETTMVPGSDDGPFAVDELTLPMQNPWRSHLRLSDVDFLSDGRAVVTSLSGDVWLVEGLGAQAGTLRWQRFATGLNQPLGVRVVDDVIHVTGRDQITRLHDRDGNGEADFYENLNNDVMAATNFHAFTMNLETDAEGRFHFAKATPWPPVPQGVPAEITPHHGVLFRMPPDGSRLEILATGLRNPNGLDIGPDGEMVYADNEGNWIPTSMVQRVRTGAFHGFVPSAHMRGVPTDADFRKPIVWIPHVVDNSPAKPTFIHSDGWPADLQGHLVLASYGRGTLSLVLVEDVDGEWQGAHVVLPLTFRSGLERARFHRDGHLYIAGLTSWQSVGHGGDAGSFHRVRFTGRPLHLPVAMETRAGGLQLRFSDALDAAAAADVQNYQITQWTYPWTSQYGTRGQVYSVDEPGRTGADPVALRSVRLSDDGKTVLLEIPGLVPGPVDTRLPMLQNLPDQVDASLGLVMAIQYTLRTADGAPLAHLIHKTIHRVPSTPLGASPP
jgi:glucose/arabinose dehydrogenase